MHEVQVAQHLDSRGQLARDEFKVVYVAPMKALAAEVTAAFSKRLQPLGEGLWFLGVFFCFVWYLHKFPVHSSKIPCNHTAAQPVG